MKRHGWCSHGSCRSAQLELERSFWCRSGVSGGIQIFLPRNRRSFRWNPDFPPLSGVGSLRRSWREVSGVGEDPGVAGGIGEEVSGAGEDPDVAGGVGWGQELV